MAVLLLNESFSELSSSPADHVERPLDSPGMSSPARIILGFGLCSIIVASIGGNLLVCIAVCTDRQLRKRSNSLFVSLAVADLLLSVIVMPVSVADVVVGSWSFSHIFCNIYISMDVMCCTASILNILFVAIDRYEHIRYPLNYNYRMTQLTFCFIIAFIWTFSILISFIPIHLGWHKQHVQLDPSFLQSRRLLSSFKTTFESTVSDIDNSNPAAVDKFECSLELNSVYALLSSTFSFFLPCLVVVILYILLYRFARFHAARMHTRPPLIAHLSIEPSLSIDTSVANKKQASSSKGGHHRMHSTSDHKAAVTLGVIMGTFLICWMPFFILNCINSVCSKCITKNVFLLVTWLGYFNSCLNPIIYSLFNLEFRNAFRKILCRFCSPPQSDLYPFPRRTRSKSRLLYLNGSGTGTGTGNSHGSTSSAALLHRVKDNKSSDGVLKDEAGNFSLSLGHPGEGCNGSNSQIQQPHGNDKISDFM